MNFKQFVNENNIGFEFNKVRQNPNMQDSEKNMDNWEITLSYNGKEYTTYYSKGFGHKGAKPTIEEVLECLHSDIYYIENGYKCEDFINEFCYDCKEGRKVYKSCKEMHEELKNLFTYIFPVFLECDEE